MPNHFSVRPFQGCSWETAAAVAFTKARAEPVPNASLTYHGSTSRWLCPPTWLQSTNTVIRAIKNCVA
jgi:hypothetical protein